MSGGNRIAWWWWFCVPWNPGCFSVVAEKSTPVWHQKSDIDDPVSCLRQLLLARPVHHVGISRVPQNVTEGGNIEKCVEKSNQSKFQTLHAFGVPLLELVLRSPARTLKKLGTHHSVHFYSLRNDGAPFVLPEMFFSGFSSLDGISINKKIRNFVGQWKRWLQFAVSFVSLPIHVYRFYK